MMRRNFPRTIYTQSTRILLLLATVINALSMAVAFDPSPTILDSTYGMYPMFSKLSHFQSCTHRLFLSTIPTISPSIADYGSFIDDSKFNTGLRLAIIRICPSSSNEFVIHFWHFSHCCFLDFDIFLVQFLPLVSFCNPRMSWTPG